MSLSSYRRRMPVSSLADLERQGRRSVGGGGTEFPFFQSLHCLRNPSLFRLTAPIPSGVALGKEVQSLLEKGAVELAPLPSPGFYS